jgi:hypothetical protein
MIRATTPTHSFELPFDYEQFVSKILITYKQGDKIVLEKTENDIVFDGNVVSYELTQEETLLFDRDIIVDIQVRVLTKGEQSLASQVWHKPIEDVLNDKVL